MTQPATIDYGGAGEIGGVSSQVTSPTMSSGAKGGSSSTGSALKAMSALTGRGTPQLRFGELPGVSALSSADRQSPLRAAFTLTKAQRQRLSGSYGEDEDKMRSAVVSSILNGDQSMGPYTEEQIITARQVAIGRGLYGKVSH